MALNDNTTLVVGAGNFFTAATDTAIPVDLTAPGGSWTNIGHTSLEDIFSISSDGGDATTLGTLQKRALRTIYSTRTDTFNFTLQQFDSASLKLYFGGNSPTVGSNVGVPITATPTTSAFLAVFLDGAKVFGFYAPKAEIFRADDMSIADTESLAGLPLGVKPLQSGSNAYTYVVTPLT